MGNGTGNGTRGEFDAKVFGPFAPIYESYVSALEQFGRNIGMPSVLPSSYSPHSMSQNMSAPFKAAARCQLEVMGLVNRRTQAYLQAPTRFAQCRSPQDVLNEQMAFWRTAAEQYTESSRKLFDAWAFADPWSSTAQPAAAARDYINFNGTGSKDGGSTHTTRPDQPTGKQRRVA